MGLIGKTLVALSAAVALGGAAFWFLTGPERLDAGVIASVQPGDAANGERMFWAGGCASCHAAPGATGDARFELAGGVRLATDFGTFVAPNISQHARDGIGGWGVADFLNAMMRGVSPSGRHYYPAFPYPSYARMQPQDVADLFAFMQTLPEVAGSAPRNDVSFPFNIRRGLGLWKRLNLDGAPVVALPGASETVLRGQYLVEGPGHCGECHTPRDALGSHDLGRWLAGGPAAEGEGTVPNITPGEGGIGDWADYEIVGLLETGFTPEFDSVGGAMAAVVRNMAELPAEDREAIAAYLMAVPPHPTAR